MTACNERVTDFWRDRTRTAVASMCRWSRSARRNNVNCRRLRLSLVALPQEGVEPIAEGAVHLHDGW